MQSIGNKILKLREAQNMTQAEMAEHLGVSRQTISSWESGRTFPGANMLQEMRNLFGVDLLMEQNFDSYQTKKGGYKMIAKRLLLLTTVLLSIVHLVGSFLDKVSFLHVLICPMLIMFIYLIMHIAFSNSIKTNDFTMIAGYKKSDSDKMTASSLSSIGLFTGIIAVVCESLFFSIYFTEVKMPVCIGLLLVFITFIAIIVFVANRKYKASY